jgi:hypothetical protein
MKKMIALMSILASLAASASELQVMKIDANKSGTGTLSTRFEVNLNDNTAGVSVKITKRHPGKNHRTTTRTFEMVVADLSLNGDVLELNVDGKVVNCGTMGITRVFKLPTLKLSGNCDVVAKRVKGDVVVSIVTE